MKVFALVTLALGAVACGQLNNSSISTIETKAPVMIATAKGTLIQVMAIGGETTGFAIKNEKGELVEVSFKNLKQFDSQALVGKQVQVDGVLKTFTGVEIFMREVLVADKANEVKTEFCDAIFFGANFNAFTGACEEGQHSGCSSPFTYSSATQCEAAAAKLQK